MLKHTPNLLHGGGSAPGHIAGAASSGRDKEFLASPDWARMLETDLLPWLGRVADLGDDVLEVGPGPGLTTDLLRQRAAKVTAVEIDEELATALGKRLAGTNVREFELRFAAIKTH